MRTPNPIAILKTPLRLPAILACLALALSLFVPGARAETLIRTINAPNSRATVVNPVTNRLYIGSGSQIHVYDGSTDTELPGSPLTLSAYGQSNTPDVYSLAVDTARNRLYVMDDNNGLLTVADLSGDGFRVLGTPASVPAGAGMAYNPVNNTAYIAVNLGPNTAGHVSVVRGPGTTGGPTYLGDIGTGSPGTVATAVDTSLNTVYAINNYDKTMSIISAGSNTQSAKTALGFSPQDIAVDSGTHRIFIPSYDQNQVVALDGTSYSTIWAYSTSAAGLNQPWKVVVDPNSHRVYTSIYGSGAVSVLDGLAAASPNLGTVLVGDGAIGMAVNPTTHKVYAGASGNKVSVLHTPVPGALKAWGYNINGELGNNTTTNSGLPVAVSGLTNVIATAGGSAHSLALRSDGSAWTWGYNGDGELGNNNYINSPVPVQVTGLTNVIAIASGYSHSLALRSDGSVWAWGYNIEGELGNNSTTSSPVPVPVSGLTNVVAIAGGGEHSLALRSDGSVWAWGYNYYGQLGNNSNTNSRVPVPVSGLTHVIAIAGGGFHSLALNSDGSVWAWGYNYYGQLGNTTTTNSSSVPVSVTGLTNVIAIAGGFFHGLALRSDGSVWAWGSGEYGQLGNNSTVFSSTTPVLASGLGNVLAIAAGAYHSLALRSDGSVRAWGSGDYDQLGNNGPYRSRVPIPVLALAGVTDLGAGAYHSLALRDTSVVATGANLSGMAGQALQATVATFTDSPADPLSSYSATIDWGDGTAVSSGTITTNASGGFNVSGSHTYTNGGSFTVAVTIVDSDGGGDGAFSTENITNPSPPVANNDSATTSLNTAVTVPVLANDTDPNGYTLTVQSVGTPSHGTAVISGSGVTYTPTAGYVGADSFIYTITDGSGTASASVNITVTDGTPPTTTADVSGNNDAINADGTLSYNGPVTVTLTATDPDNDSSTLATYYLLDSGAQQSYTGPFTVSGVSAHTLKFWSVDPSGSTESPNILGLSIDGSTPSLLSLSVSPASVIGGSSSTATVVLNAPAAVDAVIALSSGDPSVTVPASVTVTAGSSSATFPVTTTPVTADTLVTVIGTYNTNAQGAVLTVQAPIVSSLSVSPATVPGGAASTGTVTLTGIAPAGGVLVTLSSDSLDASVPGSLTIAQGQSSGSFPITTSGVDSDTVAHLTASDSSGASATASLTVQAAILSSLSLNPSTLFGGFKSIGTLTLSGIAGPGGVIVTLSSSDPSVSVPSSITIPGGSSQATFTITTSVVSADTAVTITASDGAIAQAALLTVKALTLTALSLNPSTVVGGHLSLGTVTLSGNAPAAGISVSLSSDNAAASTPANVTVAAGSSTATFTVTTVAVASNTTATIKGALGGVSQSAALAISGPGVKALTLSPGSVTGGSSSTGTLTLTSAAPTGGLVVTLSSSSASAAAPATVTVPAGLSSVKFTITTTAVAASAAAVISASVNGASGTATLTINPPSLSSFTLNPTSVTGGSTSTGTLTLTGIAPAGGFTISLSSAGAAASVPASVSVPAGAKTVSFRVTTSAIAADTSVTLSASAGSGAITQSAVLVVKAPVLLAFTLSPTTLLGHQSTVGTVTLSGIAPTGGTAITLSSDNTNAQPPASVIVPAGAKSVNFTVTTTAVSSAATATITASLGSVSKVAVLTIQPPSLVQVYFIPASVTGGAATTGKVVLNGAAPAGGVVVTLASLNSSATLPATTVTVLAGGVTANFTVNTSPVASVVQASITGTYSGVTQTGTLTINPPTLSAMTFSATSVTGGSVTTLKITLTGAAPAGGTVVGLSSSDVSVPLPASVSVPAGARSISLSVTTHPVTTATTVTATGTLGATTAQASITVK